MKPTHGLFIMALLAWSAAEMIGCGYTMTPPYPANVRTVAVPIWLRGKDVYRRELEFHLTEAVQKRIELDTPYKVTERSRADTLLEGSIDRIDQRVLSWDRDTGRPKEMEMTLVLSFTWTDLRDGRTLAKHSNFPVTATYIPHDPLREDFFQGSEDVLNRAAKRIVEQMESKW